MLHPLNSKICGLIHPPTTKKKQVHGVVTEVFQENSHLPKSQKKFQISTSTGHCAPCARAARGWLPASPPTRPSPAPGARGRRRRRRRPAERRRPRWSRPAAVSSSLEGPLLVGTWTCWKKCWDFNLKLKLSRVGDGLWYKSWNGWMNL